MTTKTKLEWIKLAGCHHLVVEGKVDLDDDAQVEKSTGMPNEYTGGAYVQVWLWVSKETQKET